MRGSFNGVILTITTTDANNKINICAFAVVPRENLESYEYLLAQAVRSKRMEKFLNKETTTCFTDGQNGVDAAVTKFARGAEIRHCLQHILRGCGRMGDVRNTCHICDPIANHLWSSATNARILHVKVNVTCS